MVAYIYKYFSDKFNNNQESLQDLKEDLESVKKNKTYDVIWSQETG